MNSRIFKKNKKVSTRKKYKGGMTNGRAASATSNSRASAAMSGTAHTNHTSHNPALKQAISDLIHLDNKIKKEFENLEKVYNNYSRAPTEENKLIVDRAFKSYTEILASSTRYTDNIIAQHPELAPPSPPL
jgi:hypothetical protein